MLGSILTNLLTTDLDEEPLFSPERAWQWLGIGILVIAAVVVQLLLAKIEDFPAANQDVNRVSSNSKVAPTQIKRVSSSEKYGQLSESDGKSEDHRINRLNLYQLLLNLPSAQFELILVDLEPPRGNLPPSSAPQSNRVAALFEWVASPVGPGIAALEDAVNRVLHT